MRKNQRTLSPPLSVAELSKYDMGATTRDSICIGFFVAEGAINGRAIERQAVAGDLGPASAQSVR